MPQKAPVDAVGGPQDEGPWPANVDEIVEGESYTRPVEVFTSIMCSEDGTAFDTMQAARDHCDANHGGDYSLIETETGVEDRNVTVSSITRHGLREDPADDGYDVSIQYNPDPAGGA